MPAAVESLVDSRPSGIPDGAAARPAWCRRAPFIAAALVLLVLLLALLSTREARVPFVLRVDGTHASFTVEGRTLQTAWPQGITSVGPIAHDPTARLFQVDGTDTSGTQTFDPVTFSATAATPYYRFLCWMRDCQSYSRWLDFSLRDDGAGRMLLRDGDPAALQGVVLPTRFTMRGVLERPDLTGDLLFGGAASVKVGFGPDARQVYAGDQSQYYPFDPRPYLAEVGWTMTRSYLWSVALLLLIVGAGLLLSLALPRRRATERPRPAPRLTILGTLQRSLHATMPYPAAALILLLLLGISNFDYERLPHLYDATAYYFEAKIMASGHLWVPVPPSAVAGPFSGPFMVSGPDSHWFAHYPPGAPLAIALGMLLRLPWVVEPVLGAVSVILIARLARRWYGSGTAWLALLLVALSPFFLFLASSYLSHIVGLCALLLCLEGVDRLAATGDWRWAALAGFGSGYSLLTREIDTVFFLLPVAIFYAWRAWPVLQQHAGLLILRHDRAQRAVAAFCVPALLCLAFYFFFNWSTTGNALLTPRAALDARDAWGFGPGHGWYNMHTLAAGLFIVENQLTALLIDLFGWPYYLTLGFFFMPLLTLRLKDYDLLLYGIAATFLLGYGGYFYHGIAYGPRYIFGSLPAYIMLTARGIVVATEVTTLMLRRLAGLPRARIAALTSTAVALAALCACNLTFYLPRQLALYHDYLEQRTDDGLAYDHVHPSWMHNAIVLAEDGGFYGDVLFPLNDPLLRGDILYARVPPTRNIKPLMVAYPGRTLYLLNIYHRHLHFQRLNVLRSPTRQITLQPPQSNLARLTIDDRGDLFASNTADGTIARFDAGGTQVGNISTGIAPGAIFPVAFWHQAVYWFDAQTSTLWHADRQGGHRSRIVLQPACAACHDFAFMPNGDVVFAATANSVLYRYSAQGILRATSSPQATMRQPAALAVTADGHVFTYDLERMHTYMFDASLRFLGTLSFGSAGVDSSAITQLAAEGDWLVGTDPGFERLIAYNTRTHALKDVALQPNGDLLAGAALALAWTGHRLAIAEGSPATVQLVSTGRAPF